MVHGEEEMEYADAGYQSVAKTTEMVSELTSFRMAMRLGKRSALSEKADNKLLNLTETAKAHIRWRGENPFWDIKQQFGVKKTRLRGMIKHWCKFNVIAVLTKMFLAGTSRFLWYKQGIGVHR